MKHVNVALFVPHYGCPHQCSFCNQKTITGVKKPLMPSDVDEAVSTALKSSKTSPEKREIAFFGGSFTAIDREYMISLLESAYKYVCEGLFKGIRISTRPDCIDNEMLDILKKYGVTSIELGAQSMSDRVLKMNERGHTSSDVENASELIKEYGIELGLQMMTGLYGDDDETAVRTCEKIASLSPATVRIYPTAVLEKTRLAELYRSGEYKPQTVDEAVNLCAKLLKIFYDNNIKVIRVGLHSGGGLDDGYITGAYHPAFRELCEGRMYLDAVIKKIKENDIKGNVTAYVTPGDVSRMAGQNRRNINYLSSIGVNLKVRERAGVERFNPVIEL